MHTGLPPPLLAHRVALRADGMIPSTHRGHGHCIAKGADDIERMMAELLGKATGYCKGKGGSMHIADFAVGMLGANGIVGRRHRHRRRRRARRPARGNGQVGGLLLRRRRRSTRARSTRRSTSAAIWKLPVVFVCENNQYAHVHPVEKAIAIPDLAERAVGYGIPGEPSTARTCWRSTR